jgi:hypothetical protein
MPLHLEYLLKDEDMLKHILAFMYRMKQFQGIFGEAAFHHRNPGFDSMTGDLEILAGVLMRHIAMVQSTSWVILTGLTKPNQPHIIQQLDNKDPEEVDMETKKVCLGSNDGDKDSRDQGMGAHCPNPRWPLGGLLLLWSQE